MFLKGDYYVQYQPLKCNWIMSNIIIILKLKCFKFNFNASMISMNLFCEFDYKNREELQMELHFQAYFVV